MKNGFLFLGIFFLAISFSVEPCRDKKDLVSYDFIVKYNGTYCAGAKPPAEMLEEIGREKPLANTTIKIFCVGKKQPSYKVKVKTDTEGKCTVKLPEGEWDYMLTSSIDKSILYINKKCSKAIKKVYGTFTVKKTDTEPIKLLYHFECDPCDPNSKKRQ